MPIVQHSNSSIFTTSTVSIPSVSSSSSSTTFQSNSIPPVMASAVATAHPTSHPHQPHIQSTQPSSSSSSSRQSRRGNREEQYANTALRKRYLVIKQLGSGSMGKVFRAIDNQSRSEVAVKVVLKRHLQDKNDKLALAREVNVLQNMEHSNIVSFKHAFEDSHAVYLATEYCSQGDLYNHLYKSKHGIAEREALKYIRQVFQAMAYLNERGISHRDIKPENVLLLSNGRVKLADFGMCFWRSPGGAQTTSRPCGTPQYSSPEIMRLEKYVPEKSDIWSCGVMLYVLLTRTLPFTGEDWTELRQQITHANVDALLQSKHAAHISKACKQLIRKLLAHQPRMRPSAAQASDQVDDILLGVGQSQSKLKMNQRQRRKSPPRRAATSTKIRSVH